MYARVHFGAHWIGDTLFGYLVGVGVVEVLFALGVVDSAHQHVETLPSEATFVAVLIVCVYTAIYTHKKLIKSERQKVSP